MAVWVSGFSALRLTEKKVSPKGISKLYLKHTSCAWLLLQIKTTFPSLFRKTTYPYLYKPSFWICTCYSLQQRLRTFYLKCPTPALVVKWKGGTSFQVHQKSFHVYSKQYGNWGTQDYRVYYKNVSLKYLNEQERRMKDGGWEMGFCPVNLRSSQKSSL